MSFNDLEQGYGVSTSQRTRPSQQSKKKFLAKKKKKV